MKGDELFELVTITTTKPRLSGNMLPNRKTCENEWWNILENIKVVAIKLLELILFVSLNISIYCNFVLCWVRCDAEILKLTEHA